MLVVAGSNPALTTNLNQTKMKIKVIHTPDEENWGEREGVETMVITNEGTKSVEFRGGEPEDMIIGRDLSDAWNIKDLLVMAYNAGKNGEDLEIEQVTEED